MLRGKASEVRIVLLAGSIVEPGRISAANDASEQMVLPCREGMASATTKAQRRSLGNDAVSGFSPRVTDPRSSLP